VNFGRNINGEALRIGQKQTVAAQTDTSQAGQQAGISDECELDRFNDVMLIVIIDLFRPLVVEQRITHLPDR
jgi:hypothetical protein